MRSAAELIGDETAANLSDQVQGHLMRFKQGKIGIKQFIEVTRPLVARYRSIVDGCTLLSVIPDDGFDDNSSVKDERPMDEVILELINQ